MPLSRSLPYYYTFLLSQGNTNFENLRTILTLVFTCLQLKSFENTVGKEEIARNEQFLLYPVFSTLLESILPLSLNLICRLQTLKFVVWERIKGNEEYFSWQNNGNEPCSVKREFNAFVKTIDPWRLARYSQADIGRNFSLPLNFLYIRGTFYAMTWSGFRFYFFLQLEF